MIWTSFIFRRGKLRPSSTSIRNIYLPDLSLLPSYLKPLLKFVLIPRSTAPLLWGTGVGWTLQDCIVYWWRGWGGGTTSTCLADCWCSHRPLASCHLWGRREAAGTLRGSCSPAHSATESLVHQGGEGGREGGGRGGGITAQYCLLHVIKLVLTDHNPSASWARLAKRR